MKTKLLFVFCVLCACNLAAQSDYSSYLTQSMDELRKGNCEGAQKWYNIYKELSGETKSSVQIMIDDCFQNSVAEKVYKINDKIQVNSLTYKVIYIEDKGKHGFAVCDYGSGPITDDMIAGRKLPTRSEMKIIYKNRHKINLTDGEYWTIDQESSSSNYYLSFYYNNWHTTSRTDSKGLLLIYRF